MLVGDNVHVSRERVVRHTFANLENTQVIRVENDHSSSASLVAARSSSRIRCVSLWCSSMSGFSWLTRQSLAAEGTPRAPAGASLSHAGGPGVAPTHLRPNRTTHRLRLIVGIASGLDEIHLARVNGLG